MSLLFSLLTARKGLVTDLSTVGVRADTTSHVATPDDHGHANYDVIIIGGGTAGCCLASRLSENSSVRVLLLESGGSGKGHIYTRIPAAFPLIFRNPRWVYQLYTEPQPFAGGKVKFWPRGKMLGGCSAINAEMAQYGAPGDFDHWAKICGDESWAWNNFKTYFTKFESYGLNEKNPNVDLNQRGTNGPVRVGYFGGVHDTSLAFVKTCEAIGIPSSPDFNVVEGQKGVNRVLTYIDDNRQRVTSQTAYLTPEVLARPNLKVAIHASVTRILFQDLAGGGKRAIGVEFANGPKAVVYQAFAKKEVILSGGAIHSPQILMLSGIGPAEDLQALDIPLVKNLPAVGSNLYDHPVVDLTFKDKTKNAPIFLKPDFNISEILAYFKAAVQYFVMGTGPMATNLTEAAAFIRSDNADLFEGEGAKADTDDIGYPDLESPDLELFTSAIGYHSHGQPLKPHSFGLHAVLLHPLSVGRISLKTSNPWDDPKMDPRYFENEADVKKLSRGVRLCLKLAQTEPLTAFVDTNTTDPRFDHTLHKKNDEEIEALVRDRVETLYHPTSTCRMAHLEDGGVVDSKLRVYGIEGLRVCDASIFPSIISGHTAGAVYAVAEKLSDILRDEFVVRSIVQ